MSILRDFERRLEGAVEGFFARAFRSGLQPVELAKALQRYMANYQQVGLDGVIVPNVFRFTLSDDDLERFSGFTRSLQRELADVARRTADEKGWTTKGPLRIEFQRSDAVRVGTYELRGKVEAPQRRTEKVPTSGRPAAAREVTAVAPVAGVRPGPSAAPGAAAPAARLDLVDGPDAPRSFRLPREAVLGRLPECDVPLIDPSVSRRHARIRLEGDRWTITDLGSTNGVKLNGEPGEAHRTPSPSETRAAISSKESPP